MAAPEVKVVTDADGGRSLVSTVGGVEVVWATVNPSQLAEARVAQGVAEPEPDADGDDGPEG